MNLLFLALSPICIIGFYMFIRDKYEKEPISQLVKGLLFGVLIAFPILKLEVFLTSIVHFENQILLTAYYSFIVAGFSEELIKFLATFILYYRNRNFNERFDGIVYAVFVSLGFAMIENIAYVFNSDIGGIYTAFLRAIFSVPLHGIFGIFMGYYISLYKFEQHNNRKFIVMSLIVPIIIHGIYDFILMTQIKFLGVVLVPYFAFIIITSLKMMKTHINRSPFKN